MSIDLGEIRPEINLFFPTPILSMKNEKYAADLLPLVLNCLSKENLVHNVLPYKSTYNHENNLEKLKEFEPFVFDIVEIAKKYASSIGLDIDKNMSVMVFASEMKRGDSHPIHMHPNSKISGVFYLQASSDAAKISFKDPRKNKSNSCVTMQPETGLFLMWESWLEHEVEISYSDESRISLVFNIEA